MKLAFQMTCSLVFGIVFFGLALFWPAGTFHYWQAWVFIAIFMGSSIVPSAYLAVNNPAALQRRLHAGPTAESRPAQRIIITATVLLVAATLVISAFDHRFGWSTVPLAFIVIGDVLVAVGLIVAQLVIIQNGYAAAKITVEADQPLVSTGLYGVVRHPMYLGVVINMIGTPLALDSLWGFVTVALAVPVLAARIVDEERMLVDELAGYPEYTTRVRSRLIPYIW
ncbi:MULTISPECIES: isoprenylcysteine carboxylmethyltransferase family protein [unclassified Mycobacterium]|uniref:methyltransferase family protein n=1 Tax=unclassified Mycobacterium TaxID=2642494 RepID=UPI0029C91F40|nr:MULTISPECIES: isoprenylcysteine carboxylmethyltransferase family protein [unclassified Mycobacterium]